MDYSKIQKTIASFLLPLFFFGLVFRFPFGDFFEWAKAINPEVNSLVSILVNEDIYSWVKSSVERYAEDIQKQLDKTRVVIIPVPTDASAFEIASMNENLYYEGYKGLTWKWDFESKLIGSVFVWKIPAPVVFIGEKRSKSILPYTDFEDKKYVYNHATNRYEKNSNNIGGISAEIWHGLIVPNKGNNQEDIEAINDFFDKDHDFYEWKGNFVNKKWIINGKIWEKPQKSYKPYVFYFDQFREQSWLSYEKYQWYEAYLENKEDLNYSRYSKELAQKIQDRVLGSQRDQITDLIKDLDPTASDLSALWSWMLDELKGPNIYQTSAISTRFITKNVSKKFLETLNSSTLGEFRKDVHNAWRYNWTGSKVNVDTIAYLISILDKVWDNIILGVNNTLEKEIDTLVKWGLSRKIAVPTTLNISGNWWWIGTDWEWSILSVCPNVSYENFLHGNYWEWFKTAADCTIYRWSTTNSWTLVQANRWYNIENVQWDIALCKEVWARSIGKTEGYWGGNSPVNFNASTFQTSEFVLNNSNLTWAITSLFDIKWGKKVGNSTLTPDPRNCFNNNYILSYAEELQNQWGDEEGGCIPWYQIPIYWKSALKWTCDTTNTKLNPQFTGNFIDNYKSVSPLPNPLMATDSCDVTNIILWWNTVKTNLPSWYVDWVWLATIGWWSDDEWCTPTIKSYSYKAIPSFIEHKSPTTDELWKQTNSMVSPNLPIDKNRYIDFIGAGGSYAKIEYPYLYRIGQDIVLTGNFKSDFDTIKKEIKNKIDKKNAYINWIIKSNNPSWLQWKDKEIFNFLSNGEYPSADFDLHDFLPQEGKDFSIEGDDKKVSYYDTLAFAIYWNNLTSVSQKYKFIIENYLSDQFKSKDKFALAKHKKSYEIAYLWAPWDAQNMYITLDPENKWENPYADIISQNLQINSDLLSSNILWVDKENENNTARVFKCAPPEGVPIWKWIPAVICWMKDILPPKIKIGKTKCSTKTLFEDDWKRKWVYDFGQNSSEGNGWYCSDDSTWNGVSDCLEEEIQNARLQVKSSTKKAWYWENITVESALFDSEGLQLSGINHINASFELVKIVAPRDDSKPFNEANSEEIYNINTLNENSQREASKYISFKNIEVPMNNWQARYNFSAKNHDANVYIRSRVVLLDKDWEAIKVLSSNNNKIEIRETTLKLSSHIISWTGKIDSWSLWLRANDKLSVFFHDENEENLESLSGRIANSGLAKNKLVLSLSHFNKAWNLSIAYPLSVKYLLNNVQIKEKTIINSVDGLWFKGLWAFSESGEYTIMITDSEWKSISKDFSVLSEKAHKIEIKLWASDIEADWNITSNLLFIKDKYENIVSGKAYDVNLKLLWGGLTFPDKESEWSTTKTLTAYEGLKVFRLKPTGKSAHNKLRIEVKDGDNIIASRITDINTLTKINTFIDVPKNLKVWWKKHTFTLTFKDEKWKNLDNFNSRAYVKINPIYGNIDVPYVEIKNWLVNVTLKTSSVAGKNIPLEFSVEGLGKTIRKNISILPGKPMKMDLVLSNSKMEASPTNSWTLEVELKDRYNNLVTTDSSTRFQLELNENSKKVVTLSSSNKTAKNWKAHFTINASANPWTAYIKVKSTPDLKINSFTIGSGTWSRLIEWVGKNATKIQSFYFWNKDKIQNNNFNWLYSVLLGAEYWDYTQKDYLAWSLLFDKNNRSLAVTSLLNNPHSFATSINIWINGGVKKLSSQWDLSQDINMKVQLDSNNKLYLDINNKATNTYIWKISYNFPNDTQLRTCISQGKNFDDCWDENEKTTITIKSISNSYSVSGLNDVLKFSEINWNTLLKISKEWKFILNPLVQLEVDSDSSQEYLTLNIKSGDSVIWKIAISFKEHSYFVTRDTHKTQIEKLKSKNWIIVELKSYMYGTKNSVSEDGSNTFSIYYNDPFADTKSLDEFSNESIAWIENFENEWWSWWKDNNKFLLSFASWKNVWESVQDYASFGIINLWDPVINLKKIKKTFYNSSKEKSFDSTIWKLLANGDDLEAYQTFDYNNDDNQDILLVNNDGYIELLENKGGWAWFLNKGELVFMADYWKTSYVKAWDFSWDWFGDIFFVNNKWEPFLYENTQKDFVRIPLSKYFNLNAKIVQVEAFDMDNDWRMDLITLDDAWNINIFYGNPRGKTNKFTKKEIANWYWMTLNGDTRNDGALVYFPWLVQISREDLLKKLIKSNATDASLSWEIDDALIDGIMFEQINYSKGVKHEWQLDDNIVASIPELTSGEFGTSSQDTTNALSWFLSWYSNDITINNTNHVDLTTFIKSEYSEVAWISIEKKYVDVNWWSLQSGDLVEVSVIIKNISSSAKNRVAYVDSIVSPFEMTSLRITKDDSVTEREAPAWYNLLVDDINLQAWASSIIKYTLKVQPITFGHIKVWLFEDKASAWDDLYGDIIIKWDNKNCSQDVEMFSSLAERTYSNKEKTSPRCDSDKLKLSDDLEKNKLDINPKNWVPDYIDELISNQDKQQEFAKDKLAELQLDTDRDGVPDSEDETPNFNWDDPLWILKIFDSENKKVDDLTEGIDNIIEWFGCWFGWDSCISSPLNWAPLAPGQDPTLFGKPIWDWLKVWEWVPIFSAFTGQNVYTSFWCFQVPTVWPASKNTFRGSCNFTPWAGWSLWINSPTNFVRLFATPTLTWGFWVAACFGWPASVAWYANPPGLSPLVPGWNCIVYAKPLMSCSNDWSEWDPESLGLATQFGWTNGFGMVNANCSAGNKKWTSGSYSSDASISDSFAQTYYNYKKTNTKSSDFNDKYNEALDSISKWWILERKNSKLIQWWNAWEYEFSVWLDFSWDKQWNFVDVQKIHKQRVAGFPWFLMDWATRQIEELVTKLTDFPTLFIILPDFGWLIDTDWGDYLSKGKKEAFNKAKQTEEARKQNIQSRIKNINSRKSGLDCSGDDEIKCLSLDVEAWKLSVETRNSWFAGKVWWAKKAFSWIRSVYDFLGNIPLVSVKPQQVNIEIPWVDTNTLNKTKLDWELSKKQIEQEWNRKKLSRNFNPSDNTNISYQKLLSNLDKNIETLESYREIPAKLSSLFNKKEEWLGQVLCNVESVSALTWGWIDQNGKRFKAWVELYVLIKAILKSWQLLVDVFADYDAECHECKNERNDLLNFEFKLIDMIIPKIPVIKFPKWPDIILDLHNIRAGLVIKMPDFNVTQKPIVLPTLPDLKLPNFDANANVAISGKFEFPDMPLLEWFDIPELHDLSWIPTVELPNLPPPPTLPKIFSSLKWILKILKLVTKAMCILKSSPFVPEWRAGDQIAFLTERKWYLPTDFLSLTLPEFSFPFVDAIKVTTWVNFEVETDFMVELAKQIVEPINSTSSNIANKFSNAGLDTLDFSSASKSINVWENVNLNEANNKKINVWNFAIMLSKGVLNLFSYLEENTDNTVSSKEFLELVNESLADESITSNPRMEKVITLWENVNKMTYHKEDMLIADLQKNSREKFEALTTIIEKEITKTQQLKNSLEKSTSPHLFKKVAWEKRDTDFVEYNTTLNKYNKKFLLSAKALLNNWEDAEVKSIRKQWENLLSRVNGGLDTYKKGLSNYNDYIAWEKSKTLAVVTPTPTWGTVQNSCQVSNNSSYSYNYKGLYVIEKNKSYRLFDYIDELSWNEKYTNIDFDSDGDIDLLYMVNGQLFLKENISIREDESPSSESILKVRSENNRFFNWEFVEAINGFRETNTDNKSINISFNAPTNTNIKHFKYEYYTIVDTFSWENIWGYIPEWVSKNIIEAFVSSEEKIKEDSESWIIERKNPATLSYAWNMSWIRLSTYEMIKLSRDLETEISVWTKIYTKNKDARIVYIDSNKWEQEKVIMKNSSVEFSDNIIIKNIYAGDIYVKGDNIITRNGTKEIRDYIWLPFFAESKIESIPDLRWSFNEKSTIEITYASWEEPLSLSFWNMDSYEVYNLWEASSDYLIKLNRPNDFLYWKIHALHNGITGTLSSQKLAAPQVEADTYAPELNFNGTIRIPVYQYKTIDLTASVYENSWFSSIKKIDIDFNLELDSNWDWNPKNDNDNSGVELLPLSNWKLRIKFGMFEELMKKKIGITITDENNNVWFKELDFEVYAPIPEINSQDKSDIQWELNEGLIWEPVNLYRLRWWRIKQLENSWGSKVVNTSDDGVYNFNVEKNASDLTLMRADAVIATIDEKSWKITKKNLRLKIEAKTDSAKYPLITLSDEKWLELYRQSIKLLQNREVIIPDSFANITKNGMYFRLVDNTNFGYYKIPTGVEHNPWAVVIHKNWVTTPLISLFPDGRLDGLNELYTLKYKSQWDYIWFDIIDISSNKIIAELLYKIEASYLMK